ncbi:MAG TPA: Ig-like domain-containing protein, partial [Candidatus Obscuribacterales bacterium]
IVDADAETYLNGLNAVTIAMWVKSDQGGSDRGFLSGVSSTGNDQNLGIRYDAFGNQGGQKNVIKVGLRTTQGVVEYESAANVQTRDWQHVVLSWQSGQAPKLYINGQLDKPSGGGGAIGGTLTGITDLLVGKGQRVSEAWDGAIDDVRIYNRALSNTEIGGIFSSSGSGGSTPTPTPEPEPTPVNQAPVAVADTYAATAGKTLTVSTTNGILANDSDPNGDALQVSNSPSQSAQGGSLKVNANGSFDYTPKANFTGKDTFNYTVSDGKGGTSNAQVTVNVAAAPAPTPTPTPIPDDDPTSFSSLERKVRTKELSALQEIYNVTFDKRGKPDVHVGLAASDTILLKVQQNELFDNAYNRQDWVAEPFNTNLTKDNIEVVLPGGQVMKPTAVHRKSKVADSTRADERFIVDHYYHIELPADLDDRTQYTLRFTQGNLETIAFTPEDTISLAIHHTRAYDITTPSKVAKLSSWMSKAGGGVDYAAGTPFQVIDEVTGRVVHTGAITLAGASDRLAGTDVYNLDFSAVTAPGTYRLQVEGIGKSLPFEIRENVWETMLDISMEGLYVHRAFAELEQPYTSFERPGNPDIVFYQSSVSEADIWFFNEGDRFKLLPATADRSQPIKLSGGWFDAGDFDTNFQHFEVIFSLVDLYNTNPDYFAEFDPNIPESGNRIPDVLDEALWGMQLYKQLQRADGAVSAGFEFDSHPGSKTSWEETEAFIYAPDFYSSYQFASAAAKLSTALQPFDPAQAADLQNRAVRAIAWAEQEYAKLPTSFNRDWAAKDARQLAAVELYRLTKDEKYHDIFESFGDRRNYKAGFTYAQLDPSAYRAVDTTLQQRFRSSILNRGNELITYGQQNAFGTINDPKFDQTWGW